MRSENENVIMLEQKSTEDLQHLNSNRVPLTQAVTGVLTCFGVTYIILPLILLVFGGPILRELTYLNHFRQGPNCDINTYLEHMEVSEHTDTANIDIESSQGYKIPVWQFLSKNPDAPLIIYSHGNAGTRC